YERACRLKFKELEPSSSMDNKVFRYALIASLLIHIVILWNLAYLNIHFMTKTMKPIRVAYSPPKLQKKIDSAPSFQKSMKVDLAQEVKAAKAEQKNIASFTKDISKIKDDFIRQEQKPKVLEQKKRKRRVTVPPIKTLQIKNPLYLSYYQIVRNRIKERAYANYMDSGKFDSGEVYLAFILDASGSLKKINIIEDRTRANQHLRQISTHSVEESGPFPSFPKELNYPELSFNVVISFEVE
ncbi:MAG: hypothetical protein NT079_05550, partial [Candidatus Omnitrophica bacterium]|nr:hypothetical protein [Candidatus Omnitrophota bacterium]